MDKQVMIDNYRMLRSMATIPASVAYKAAQYWAGWNVAILGVAKNPDLNGWDVSLCGNSIGSVGYQGYVS